MNRNDEATRAYFDGLGNDWYGHSTGARPFEKYPPTRLPKTIGYLGDLAGGRDRVLDLGCGNGPAFEGLLSLGFREVHAIDFAAAMVCEAEKRRAALPGGDRIVLATAELDAAYPQSDFFDAAIALGVACYQDDVGTLLAGLARVLKPGGVACLDFRNRAFNLFSSNAYTAALSNEDVRELVAEFAAELDNFTGCDRALDPEHFRAFADTLSGDGLSSGGKDAAARVRTRDFGRDFNMRRGQHTPADVRKLLTGLPLACIKIDYCHFHPFPPVFEKFMPRVFNSLGVGFEPLGASPLGFFQASSFLAVLRKDAYA